MTSEILRRHQVNVLGKGTRALLFAHGLACDQKAWRLITPAFESEFQVILFDYIGSGQTDTSYYDPYKYSSLRGYAADVLAICEDLGLQDVTFVGHSVSSMIGLLAAVARPDLFFRLIMIGPSPRYINDQHYFGGFEKEEIDELLSGMQANYTKWAGFFAPLAMANPDQPELSRELKNSFCHADPAITCDFARVTFQGDNRKDLANLHTPSLILQTCEDIVAPEQVGDFLHQHMSESTLYKMKATGHFPQLSAPEETIALMKKYLKENDPFNK